MPGSGLWLPGMDDDEAKLDVTRATASKPKACPLTPQELAEFRLLAYRRLAGQFPGVRSRDVRAWWGAESMTMEFDKPGPTRYGYVTEAYVLANRGTPQGREIIVDAIIYEALGDEWESDL